MNEEKLSRTAVIRKVSVLRGRAKKEAEKMDLEPDDLVIVGLKDFDPLPDYELEKIEGDPVSYLLGRRAGVLQEREGDE